MILSCFENINLILNPNIDSLLKLPAALIAGEMFDCTVFGPREGALGAASEDGDELGLVELPPQVLFLGILRGEPACSSHEGNLRLREHSTTSPHDSTTGTPFARTLP